MLKKVLSIFLCITLIFGMLTGITVNTSAEESYDDIYSDTMFYLNDYGAQQLIAFIYNKNLKDVTSDMLSQDNIFNYITGRITHGSKEYINAQISFLNTLENAIDIQMQTNDEIVAVTTDNLIKLLENQIGAGESLTDTVIDEEMDQLSESMLGTIQFLFDLSEDTVADAGIIMGGYKDVSGIKSKVEAFLAATEGIINSSFLLSSYNMQRAYEYFSTYVNWREFGPDSVELMLAAISLDSNIFDGMINILSALGFGNSWSDTEIKRMIRLFAEFTYQSQVEYEYFSTYVPLKGIEFDITNATIFADDELEIAARTVPSNATNNQIKYFSGDTGIATVGSSGNITVNGVGSVNIYAQAEDGSLASYTLNILPFYAASNSDGYTLTEYIGSAENVIIPSYVNGKPVTEIGGGTFNGCENLVSVTIPDTVSIIGTSAFIGCTNLSDINFGNGIKQIYEFAFQKCYSLTEITLPSSVETIGEYAFSMCTGLKTVYIPDSVKSIGNYAFWDATSLESIRIPFVGGMADMGQRFGYIFGGESADSYSSYIPESLKKVVVSGKGASIPAKAFLSCKSITEIIIENGVTEINSDAFYNCENLSSVSLPDSLLKIGDHAFCYCKTLSSVTIPNSVTDIGENAFAQCTALSEIKLPSKLSKIDRGLFAACIALKSIELPSGIESIAPYAFNHCLSLTEIVIPEGMQIIDYQAFNGCTALSSVSLPDSLTEIRFEAFENCDALTELFIPKGVKAIGMATIENCFNFQNFSVDPANTEYCSVNGVLYNKDKTELVQYPVGKTDTAYSALDTTEKILGYAFADNRFIKELYLPEGVTAIGEHSFRECTSLSSISELPNLKTLGRYAFSTCEALENLDFLKYLDSIPEYAFENCISLKVLNIPDNIKSIGIYSFTQCSGLTTVEFSDNITVLPEGAFSFCTALDNVKLPYNLVEIGAGAFGGCSSIKQIKIPEKVGTIGQAAFAQCVQLEKMIFLGREEITFTVNLSNIFTGVKNLSFVSGYNSPVSKTEGVNHLIFCDFNADGIINAVDFANMRKLILENKAFTADEMIIVDCNFDEEFDIRDLVRLKKQMAE